MKGVVKVFLFIVMFQAMNGYARDYGYGRNRATSSQTRAGFYNQDDSSFYSESYGLRLGADFATTISTKVHNSSFINDKSGYEASVPSFNLSLGREFTEMYRADLTFAYRDFNYGNRKSFSATDYEYQSHKSKVYMLMLDNYFKAFTFFRGNVIPYAMVGIGISKMHPDGFVTTETAAGDSNSVTKPAKDSIGLAYQAGIGTEIKIIRNLSLDTSLRYVHYGKMKFLAGDNISLTGFEFLLGLGTTF